MIRFPIEIFWVLVKFFGIILVIKIFFDIILPIFIYPTLKGKIGEWRVEKQLSLLDQTQYKILNNVMLETPEQTIKATQIDHLIISEFGIFCLETKNYNGWIFGRANDFQWTQQIFHHRNKIYNPLRQNYAHQKAIESFLISSGHKNIQIVPIIIFPSADKLKVSGAENIVFLDEVIPKIKKYSLKKISEKERNDIYEKFAKANITDKQKRKQHITDIKNKT